MSEGEKKVRCGHCGAERGSAGHFYPTDCFEYTKAQFDSTRSDLHEGLKTIVRIQDENDCLRASLSKAEAERDEAREEIDVLAEHINRQIEHRKVAESSLCIAKAAIKSVAVTSRIDVDVEKILDRIGGTPCSHAAELAKAREAIKWGCDYYPYADLEWFRTELRRRSSGGA